LRTRKESPDLHAGGASGPHKGQPLLTAGPAPEDARAAMILVHGRGGTAEGILGLAAALDLPGIACLAPQAAGHAWYPASFLAPLEQNEPGLTSGLAILGGLVDRLDGAGNPAARTILLGFSQGACLTLEFAARNPRRYGGVAGLSGGLIGPPGTARDYRGSLDGTPIFLGCSDVDPHIPLERVEETAEVLGRMGAAVTTRIYPGLGHTVNDEELDYVRRMAASIL
jgi:predicted esterase